MKASKLCAGLVLILFSIVSPAQAQSNKADIKQNEQKVKDMVAFLEYVLNTVGSSTTSNRDKDVLITESYTKIFRDGKVQVEDDLVENRNVITNKDVQAYLKDVDFFFSDVKFEFTIKSIQGKVNANDKLFYKVSIVRNMRGSTSEGKVVNNTSPRFIEINYDPKEKDLKIVSIYTKEFDEKAALLAWWKELSFEWQSIFKKKLNITKDSVQLADIKNIISINAIDLSQNKYLKDFEPLTRLVDLQSLNLANTSITDLSPLRNLTGLVELDLSNTQVSDITPLKYSDNLVKFNINNSPVADLAALEKMTKLENLEMRNVSVTDFTPVSNATALKFLDLKNTKIISLAPVGSLTNLTELNLSGTIVDDLKPLAPLKNLATLTLDSTRFTDASSLAGLESLKVLSVNRTSIKDLSALEGLKQLARVYCDDTPIKRAEADAFMASNPGVLVIFDSKDLRGWWDALPATWQTVLSKAARIQMNPTNEDLAKIPNLDSLNISGNAAIQDVEPLRKLQKLQVLVATKTSLKDITPLREHRAIRSLDVSGTRVSDISVVHNFSKLKELRADETGVQNLDALANLSGLKKLYVDQTSIADSVVQDFLHKQPLCLVVFKTDALETWWNDLPNAWKDVLETQTAISPKTRKEDLHKLVELEALHFKDAAVSNLSVLQVFVRLKELDFSGTGINDISPLIDIKSLRILRAANSPIRNLEALRSITTLTDLDISNTPIEDLKPMRGLENLKSFNCGGTQVSSLTALEELINLEILDCSNTGVKRIDAIENLPLKTLKCYNTNISSKTIEKFKRNHPACNVIFYK